MWENEYIDLDMKWNLSTIGYKKPNSAKASCATLWTSSAPSTPCAIANICGKKVKRKTKKFALNLKVHKHTSISTGAQYVTLDNKIKCLNLAIFLATPPIKL